MHLVIRSFKYIGFEVSLKVHILLFGEATLTSLKSPQICHPRFPDDLDNILYENRHPIYIIVPVTKVYTTYICSCDFHMYILD